MSQTNLSLLVYLISLSVLTSLLLPVPALAQISVSQSGDTLSFSGSMHIMDCSTGHSGFKMFLKNPGGDYIPLEAHITPHKSKHGSGRYVYTSHNYDYSGTINTSQLAPGSYEIVADGHYSCFYYYDTPVLWKGDKKETASFSTGPDWSRDGSRYTKTFTLNTIPQTTLVLSANQYAECSVNGHPIGRFSKTRMDITPYLKTGQNRIVCTRHTGYEKVCDKHNIEDCGCHCWARPNICATLDPYFYKCEGDAFCTYKRYRGLRCYIPAVPRFEAGPVFHSDQDILWSNNNKDWYYSKLPVEESTTWYEKPDYYEDGKVYEGIRPFEGTVHFNKWYYMNPLTAGGQDLPSKVSTPKTLPHVLYASALTEPSCTLNSQPLTFEPNEDDWWVWRANTTLQSGLNQVLCTVRKNDYYSFLDLKLVPLSTETFTNLTTPFQFTPGQSGPTFRGQGFHPKAGDPNPVLPLPATPSAPLGAGAAAAAAGSVAVAAFLSRRRSRLSNSKSTKSHFSSLKASSKGGRPKPQEINQSHLTKFLSKVAGMRASFRERLADIRKENLEWKRHKERVKRYWNMKKQQAVTRVKESRVNFLSGNTPKQTENYTRAQKTIKFWQKQLESGKFTRKHYNYLLNNHLMQFGITSSQASQLRAWGGQIVPLKSLSEEKTQTGLLDNVSSTVKNWFTDIQNQTSNMTANLPSLKSGLASTAYALRQYVRPHHETNVVNRRTVWDELKTAQENFTGALSGLHKGLVMRFGDEMNFRKSVAESLSKGNISGALYKIGESVHSDIEFVVNTAKKHWMQIATAIAGGALIGVGLAAAPPTGGFSLGLAAVGAGMMGYHVTTTYGSKLNKLNEACEFEGLNKPTCRAVYNEVGEQVWADGMSMAGAAAGGAIGREVVSYKIGKEIKYIDDMASEAEFASQKHLSRHIRDHPDIGTTSAEYMKNTKYNMKVGNKFKFFHENQYKYGFYNSKTNTFTSMTKSGVIKTTFKPTNKFQYILNQDSYKPIELPSYSVIPESAISSNGITSNLLNPDFVEYKIETGNEYVQ